MNYATQARAVERILFGALIGTLVGVLVCRMILLADEVNIFILALLLAVGAWSGGLIAHFRASQSETTFKSLRELAVVFRRLCLRIMLWLLGAAAVFGVLSVLTASYDVVGRIALTACITAAAAGLLWPFSVMTDRDRSQGAGLFGAASILLMYCLLIPSVWNLGHNADEAAIAALIVAALTPAGLVAMMLLQTRTGRVAGAVGITLYATVLTIYLIALWSPGSWYRHGNWWMTGSTLATFGTITAACLVGVGTGDRRFWRWSGVLAAVAGGTLFITDVWTGSLVDNEVLLIITSLAVVVAHANLVMFVPLKARQAWLRSATILAVAVAAICLDLEVWFALSNGGEVSLIARLSLAFGILASCGTLALLVLMGLNRVVNRPTFEDKIATIAVACPKCGTRQTIPLDEASCSRCGLRIVVRIEAPEAADGEPKGDCPFETTNEIQPEMKNGNPAQTWNAVQSSI